MKSLLIFCLLLTSCHMFKDKGSDIYSLYRGGAIMTDMRMQYATFNNATESGSYNKDNCERLATLLTEESQYGLGAKYWCEKGEYKE